MAELFTVAVCILILGFLWFWVVRPILADFGVLKVSVETPAHSVDLSRTDNRQATQTDRTVTPLSVIPPKPPRLAVDRTRGAVMEELLTNGWTVAELRREGIFRGDNATIGKEVTETRVRLGLSDPDRTIKIRDEKGERVIPA